MSIMVGLFCASIGKQGLIASESIEGEKIYNEDSRRSAQCGTNFKDAAGPSYRGTPYK